jgi:alanyl-tRNA synthetase
VLGKQVQQRGSLVTPDRFRFDFSHLVAMMPDEIQKVQRIVNENIRQNLEVYAEEMSYQQALEQGAIAFFDEKYGDKVRALKIGKPPVSFELCGGTHVSATGQIGFFHIVSESSVGSGLRRIEAVTGRGVEKYFESLSSEWQEVAKVVGATTESVKEKVMGTVAAFETERKQRQNVEKEFARKVAESLLPQTQTINGVNVIYARVPSLPPQTLREMGDFLRDKLKSVIIVLITVYERKVHLLTLVTQDLVDKGYNASNIVREVAQSIGGSGGGRPNMAQASSADIGKVDVAIASTAQIVRQYVPPIP